MSQPNQVTTDPVAVEFVETEWQQARASLRRSRIAAVASVLFVIAYMSFLTVTLTTRLLEPKAAAAVTTHYVSGFVQENGAALSQQIIREVPRYVAHAPDYALAQLPVMRADLEQKLETILTEYSRAVTPQLSALVEQFLTDNQAAIRELIVQGSDPATIRELGDRLEEHVLVTFAQKNADGVSANDRLADGVAALRLAREQLHRLAYATDLTPEEKQLRRVLGLVLQQAQRSRTS